MILSCRAAVFEQCNETIKGAYISALDQSWHPDHFVCTHCSEPFGGNQFRKHDNKPYCEKHFEELFAPKCAACGLGIAGQVFEALDQKYHLDCFSQWPHAHSILTTLWTSCISRA